MKTPQRRKGAETQPNRAKRLDCAELAPAFGPPPPCDSASPSSVTALRRVDCGGWTSRSHLSSMSSCNTPNLTSKCRNHSMLRDQPRVHTGAPPGHLRGATGKTPSARAGRRRRRGGRRQQKCSNCNSLHDQPSGQKRLQHRNREVTVLEVSGHHSGVSRDQPQGLREATSSNTASRGRKLSTRKPS